MKNLKNKDDLVNFNIFKLTVKNSLHLVWAPCRIELPYVRKIQDMSGVQLFCREFAQMSGILLKCPEFL